jgi:hypothetical protein
MKGEMQGYRSCPTQEAMRERKQASNEHHDVLIATGYGGGGRGDERMAFNRIAC